MRIWRNWQTRYFEVVVPKGVQVQVLLCAPTLSMTPHAALERQLALYRAMTCEQRVGIALRLHELACEMARLGIRRQHPEASPAEIETFLRQRLQMARGL